MLPPCPARHARKASVGRPVARQMISSLNFRVSWKPVNPQECVWKNESLLNCHEDHVAGRGDNSQQHYNLVYKFIPMPHAMKTPAAKAAVDKLEKIPAWNQTKVRSKSEVIDEARTSGATVHFASLMDICHLKNAEMESKQQKYNGRVVPRNDIVKYDFEFYAAFSRTRIFSITNDCSKSYGYHIHIARIRRTSSGRSICLYRGRNGRCSKIVENS